MPREDKFFDLFAQHSRALVAGATGLDALLAGGDAMDVHAKEIVEQEQRADDITRAVLESIRRRFITPFDRADIQDTH